MMVIHDIGQMISWKSVGFDQHLVINLTPGDLYISPNDILKFTKSLSGCFQAYDELLGFCPLIRFLLSQITAFTILPRGDLFFHLLFSKGFQTLGRAKTAVSLAFVHQSFNSPIVNIITLTLKIWTVFIFFAGTRIEFNA